MNNFLFLVFFACLSPSFAVRVEEELISIEVQEAPSLTEAEELLSVKHENGQVDEMLQRKLLSVSKDLDNGNETLASLLAKVKGFKNQEFIQLSREKKQKALLFFMTRNAVADRRLLWPNGTMYYNISNEYTNTERKIILHAMWQIENDVKSPGFWCILFERRRTETNYVFIHKGDGCNSQVGLQHQGQQEVSIGEGCGIKGIIIHELLHSLGFAHEQMRFDRDTYVTVNDSNIKSNMTENFVIYRSTALDTLGVDYSFDSIMHYGPYTGAVDNSKPVIQPKPGKFNVNVQMGQKLGLSSSDVKKIQLLYNCPVDTAHVPSFINEIIYACHFENISSSLRNETGEFCWTLLQGTSPGPQSGNTNGTEMFNKSHFENSSSSLRNETEEFDWTLHQGATSTGPLAGNTNGADQYFVATADGHHGHRARFTTPPHDQGTFCLSFFYFQNSTSYLNVIAVGDGMRNKLITSTRGKGYNKWYNARLSIFLAAGYSFQITFEAVIDRHDVAIDDLIMQRRQCL